MNIRQFGWAILLSVPLVAWAGTDKSPDESFYYDAAEGGIAEIEQGNLAQNKGQGQGVKEFGAMMVRDHTAALDKLRAIAARKGIDLPTSAGVKATAAKGRLEILSGESFDKSYIRGMVKDHEADIQAFENEAHNGQDREAKAFAAAMLPTLREHLKKIRSIAAAAGVSAA
jgi:putative membrane protein